MKLLVLLLLSVHCYGQNLTAYIGGATALTDLGGNHGVGEIGPKDIEYKQIHLCFSLELSKHINDYEIGLQYTQARLSGSDSIRNYGGAEASRIIRKHKFSGIAQELAITFKYCYSINNICLFPIGGAGILRYDNKIKPILVYGFGASMGISEVVSLKIVGLDRRLFTDYLLDGVSDRPYSKYNDTYINSNIGLSINLGELFENDVLKCPKF